MLSNAEVDLQFKDKTRERDHRIHVALPGKADSLALAALEGADLPTREHATRRSTRLSLEIPVVLTSIDPAYAFRKECKTVVVNAHGCGVIVPERLKNETPVMLNLVSNGAIKKGRVVLAIPLLEDLSWLLGVEFDSPGNFWEVENPPTDWHT